MCKDCHPEKRNIFNVLLIWNPSNSKRLYRLRFNKKQKCVELQSEKDFRDKLSSIFMALNLTLDETAANEVHGLQPILNYQSANVIERKVRLKDLILSDPTFN